MKEGWTTRVNFDDAQQKLLTAQAQVDFADAQVRIAREQQNYTVLLADAPGAVTSVGAESGEVVRAGQMIVQVAREGGRDAVFDVPEQLIGTGPRDPTVEIALTEDATVKAIGRVREVSPQADAATRTFQVKVAIADTPDGMRLVLTVIGRIKCRAFGVEILESALAELDGHSAVWIVDPRSQTVSLRGVEVARYEQAAVVISKGLEQGNSSSRPECRPCAQARRSALWEPPRDTLQPLPMGHSASLPRELLHADHNGCRALVLLPAWTERGPGLHRQDDGGAGRMAGRRRSHMLRAITDRL